MGKLRKAAVVFPGIGYHTDKPLLFYSKKLAWTNGYEIIDVPYGHFEHGIKGNEKKMRKACESALKQAGEILKDKDLEGYDELVFLSKSIGTAAAAAYAEKHHLIDGNGRKVRHIYFTPVADTFLAARKKSGIVFHGTADPWAPDDIIEKGCRELELPLYIVPGANHSLETGSVDLDLKNIRKVMARCAEYLTLENR